MYLILSCDNILEIRAGVHFVTLYDLSHFPSRRGGSSVQSMNHSAFRHSIDFRSTHATSGKRVGKMKGRAMTGGVRVADRGTCRWLGLDRFLVERAAAAAAQSTQFHGQWSNDRRIATLHTFSVLRTAAHRPMDPWNDKTCDADIAETLYNLHYIDSVMVIFENYKSQLSIRIGLSMESTSCFTSPASRDSLLHFRRFSTWSLRQQ